MSTGEKCTCEYVTLLQSFHRGTLSTLSGTLAVSFEKNFIFRCHIYKTGKLKGTKKHLHVIISNTDKKYLQSQSQV